MADNPYVNKVQKSDGSVIMDITDTTAEPSDVAAGEVFYTASGARSVGTGALNIIDDTAGDGDTDKTWSADKLVDVFDTKVSSSEKGVANGVASLDSTGKVPSSQLPGNAHVWVGTCDTAAATRDKAVTITGVTEYKTGDVFIISFDNAQTYNGAPRLNINSLGVKTVRRTGENNAGRYQWRAGETETFVYDGTYMRMVNNGLADTTYYGLTKLISSCTSTSSTLAMTASGMNAYSERMIAGVPLYDEEATYAVGDRVRYSWYIYECNTAITEAEAWNAEHWTQLPALQTQINNTESTMAIIISGDTAPQVITEGKYVYLKNHSTLPVGLYHATAYINSGDSISLSNVVADTDGGINALQEKIGDVGSTDLQTQITTLNGKFTSVMKTVHTDYRDGTYSGSYTASKVLSVLIFVNSWDTNPNNSGLYTARLNTGGYSITPIKAAANATITVNGLTVSYTMNSLYTGIHIVSIGDL